MSRRKRWSLLGVLVLLLLFSGAALAQNGSSSAMWTASYWDNISLSGDPVLIRTETAIDDDWGQGSPAAVVPADRFSARWTGTLSLPAGRYRFDLTADDGARLYVDGNLIIDAWRVQAVTTYSAETITSGHPLSVQVEYFENSGLAKVGLSWTRVTAPQAAWQAEYFDNTTLSGQPALVRDVPAIDFNWGTGSPDAGRLDPNAFSARWTRELDFPAGTYRFTMTVDDGGRLWVNDQQLIDRFVPQAATTYQAEITLPGGPVPVVMEYNEIGGVASARLRWQQLTTAGGSGTVVIDDNDNGFVWGGPQSDWDSEPEGYRDSLLWTRNSRSSRADYNWGVWYPDLTAGVYEVSVYVPERYSTTSQARYWVSHANGFDLTVVDQSANGSSWVTLGTYRFDGSADDYVSLADVTLEADASRLVAYDAMRFIPTDRDHVQARATLSQQVAAPGDTIQVAAAGFPPQRTIYLQLGPPATEPVGLYDQGQTDASGAASLSFTVPDTWPDGSDITVEELVVVLITTDGTKATVRLDYRD